MSPPAWAYHLDNFDPPPDDELVCSVCRSVFCDPVQSPCNHVFCRSCLTKWLETSRTCPICRKRISRSSMQEVVPLIRNMIMKLILHCRNSENGCTEKFSLEGCESHVKACTYEMVQCKNRPCTMMFMRKDIREHEHKNCPHRVMRCKKCCLKVPSLEPSNHDCIKALKSELERKNADLKKKTKKIKKLQEEVKKLKLIEQDSSDQSSLGSVSATDIMIDLFPSLPSSDVGSSPSDNESNSYISISEDGQVDWFDDFLDPEVGSSDHNDDIAIYRPHSPLEPPTECPLGTLDTSGSAADDEPLVRRPPKRRYAARIVDTTDDENEDDLELASLPSPKRSWVSRNNSKMQSNSSENSQAVSSGCWDHNDTAGPSHSAVGQDSNPAEESLRLIFGGDGASHSMASGDSASNSRFPFELRSRSKKQPTDGQTTTIAPVAVNNSPVFERTIAMLEKYNLESDPEWLPSAFPHSALDSSDSDISVADDLPLPDSYGSSITYSPSDSSDEDDMTGTHNLFYSSSLIHRMQPSYSSE